MRAAIGLIALTEGVVAVIITIMVLELKPPRGADLVSPALAYACYAGLAIWWLVPDRRVEAALARETAVGRERE